MVTKNVCQFELFKLKENDKESLPIDANAFFELYIVDKEDNLIDVPVLIKNFRESDGTTPNLVKNDDKNRLVHRFFIYDTISGIDKTGGYADNEAPKYVRYAQTVQLNIVLDDIEPNKIHKPLLEITYQEYQGADIVTNSTVEATYFVDYYQEVSKYETSILVIFIITTVLVLVITL